jgi:3-isopropylmalate dehydrogenase
LTVKTIRCGVMAGDGIGPEIVPIAEEALKTAASATGGKVDLLHLPIGHLTLKQQGTTFPADTVEKLRGCDGCILGPVDHATYPSRQQGGINPSGECRKQFVLTSNVRPARAYPNIASRYPELDCIVVRENTEGFYADRSMIDGTGEFTPRADLAFAIGVFSKERIVEAMAEGISLARSRRGRLAFAHKANVLPKTMGLYLAAAKELAAQAPDVTFESHHMDALMARIVQFPQDFDVIVTENLSGDYLSDLTAGMVGGLGVAPSLNIGADYAMAQAVHGSAPSIAGQGKANPMALVLSVAMLLRWWARRGQGPWCAEAAKRIEDAVDGCLRDGPKTTDLGGSASTTEFGKELIRRIA